MQPKYSAGLMHCLFVRMLKGELYYHVFGFDIEVY